ncbi:MAG: aminoacetone oxidase family FAD-binding enzyme, partial [Desulfobacterium sp.]|nr:aminoacetone oxidase family FAD-binding enzyme [Desulfobacterium sp.]
MLSASNPEQKDVIIIGAGASGLMCAMEAGKRKRRVLVIDHAKNPGQKLLISGGGRCNFTNYHIQAGNYISHNPHFCKSALSQYTQMDFLALLKKHHVAFSQREQGQLFCTGSSREILDLLLSECQDAGVSFKLSTKMEKIEPEGDHCFTVYTDQGNFSCNSLVVATGGLSIPSTGASPLGYEIAKQFHIKVWPPHAGLVPFTLQPKDKEKLAALSGISIDAVISNQGQSFRGNILFTHRGLSGPAVLQISSYWQPGDELTINLLPDLDLVDELKAKKQHPQQKLKTVLAEYLPKRLVAALIMSDLAEKPLQTISHTRFREISSR